jgi:hypothetical protein
MDEEIQAMSEEQEIWELRRGDVLVGRLVIYDQDMFWYTARFEPTAEFAPYRPLFQEGAALREGDDPDRWAAWQEQVRGLGLMLVRLRDNVAASDFILYIDGAAADFRPRFEQH